MTDPILSTNAAVTPDLAHRIRHMSPIIAVVGDAMLDGWWRGRSTRIAREAPAPVVRLSGREFVAGGAANAAMNLAALGARVRMIGLVGDDEAGRLLRELLDAQGIDVSGLVAHAGIRTTTKDRIMVGDQILVRLDDGQDEAHPDDALDALAEAIRVGTSGVAAELICDYETGMLAAPIREALVNREERPPLTVVDAHDPARWAPLRPHLITPNADELGSVLGLAFDPARDRARLVADLAPRIFEETGAEVAVVTLDRDGTVLLGRDGTLHRTWARATTDKQASGAGDTFAAALTVGRACGLPVQTAADLAQAAANVVVSRFGTSVCSTGDLVGYLAQFSDSDLEEDELTRRIREERALGKRIVLTNGCFDVLHRGHTAYLNQAKRLGDVLIVAINSDDSVRRLKGPSRPINASGDRASVLAALSCVDYVTVFTTDTPIPLIERIKPDVYAKGGDYTEETLPETEVVRGYGGDVRILDFLPGHSTTRVVDRIRTGPHGGGAVVTPVGTPGAAATVAVTVTGAGPV